jgi:molybdopterin converting factor small subunit
MKVQVLFFGATAEEVGEREIEIDLEAGTRSENAFESILEKYPQLENHSLLFAINQEYAAGDETIKEGDELAVFTAVSGG